MLSFDENLCMDRQDYTVTVILWKQKKFEEKKVGLSIEPPSANSYSSTSG